MAPSPNPSLPLLAGPVLMLRSLRARALLRRKAGEIYGAIVTQARQPEFYAKLGILDTPAGRYETVVVHLFLVLERLRSGGARPCLVARALVEAFVADMDDSLRELGTGDVAVARKVKRAAAGLYERSAAYRAGLAEAGAEPLGQALARHIPGLKETDAQASALASYVRMAIAGLSVDDVLDGRIVFPPLAVEDLQ